MGHRVSKTTILNEGSQVENTQAQAEAAEGAQNSSHHHLAPSLVRTTHATEPSGLQLSTINLQIETPNAEELRRRAGEESNSPAAATATATATSPRQIIIKIQLAKMENEMQQQEQLLTECSNDNRSSNSSNSNPLPNSNNNGTQFLNLTFNRNTPNGEFQTTTADSNHRLHQQCSARSVDERTAGGSPSFVVNNNFSSNVVVTSSMTAGRHENFNILMAPMSELQLDDKRMSVASVVSSPSSSTSELVENSNAAEAAGALSLAASSSCAEETAEDYCCRRKSKSSTFPNKSRCYKCTCRDAYKSIKNASTSKSNKKKEQKVSSPKSKEAQQHSSEQQPLKTPLQTTGSSNSSGTAPPVVNNVAATPSQMSIWSPSSNDVIISSPQFVVVQCPPSSVVTIDDNAIRLLATEMVAFHSNNPQRLLTTPADLNTTPAGGSISTTSSSGIATPNREAGRDVAGGRRRGGGGGAAAGVGGRKGNVPASGTVVHSQVDYIHCLVPDLERITKSSFYWGKMDRYEAERLLEGKAEGTFLLRDSAQEEYLFSVTFRKYGRSLHARIEQNNHKFSFDCHDPCVFTANTVTGLLEHYKDPACVMFFEPMLTIPLHRNTTFSLQQLCRATIASNTSYDGINELELPSRLKSYLKEYHYKQKLRVKPFDEAFYSCT